MADEEWLVSKAKSCLKSDIYAAKAWLITARTLYPRNFNLQFEAYSIEKNSKNVRQAAKILEDMLVQFPREPILWQEIQTMIDALQVENKEEKSSFLSDIFGALPNTMQSHMLIQVADSCQDPMLQLRLSLLILTRHTDQLQQHGVKLIDKLLNNEKQAQMTSAVNCYRKYLVCDVLPLVLKSELPQVQPKQLIRWLQKSIEFYVCYVTQPPQAKSDTPLSPGPELGSPKFPGCSGLTNKWRVSIPGLSDKESIVERPLHRLGEILALVAYHLKWDIKDFTELSSEYQWQRIVAMSQALGGSGGEATKQVLYCATILFFTSAFHYACGMMPSEFAATASGNSMSNAVLIEGPHAQTEPRVAGLHDDGIRLTASKKLSSAKEIAAHFTTALSCWKFLHDKDYLSKEFLKLLQHWKYDNWMWLKSFEIDVLIYQGKYKDASAKLLTLKSIKQKPATIPLDLQLASCFSSMGNHMRACETLVSLVEGLSQLPGGVGGGGEGGAPGEQVALDARQKAGSGRHLQLMLCTEPELMPYAIHLLITCFKEKALKAYPPVDVCMGHLLVLIQYDWPRYHTLLKDIFARIIQKESFTYNLFFNYIINIDILEEIAHLKSGVEGKVNLDILPISTKALAQSRTVTRGVNKGVKEDFKTHLEKQVLRSGESVDAVLHAFLADEGKDLLHSLA